MAGTKKNILIIGASSFIGGNLINKLKKDYNVYGTYFKNNKNFNKKNYFKVNLKSEYPFKNLKKNDFNSIIWCINNNRKKKNYKEYDDINILGLIKLMNFLSLKKLDKFIFLSTGSVYLSSKKKINEKSKIDLNNSNSFTKYYGEKLCKVYSQFYNFRLIILRPFTIYGKNQKNKLIFNLIKKIKNNENIYVDGKCGIKLSCINVNDASKVISYLLSNFKKSYGLYNLSSPYNYNINEFCKIISKKLKKRTKIIGNNKNVNNYVSAHNSLMKQFNFLSFDEFVNRNL